MSNQWWWQGGGIYFQSAISMQNRIWTTAGVAEESLSLRDMLMRKAAVKKSDAFHAWLRVCIYCL